MAEYTIPKPYRDFYVTNPYIELKESNERLEEETLVRSDIQYGASLYGKNTLENKEITVKVESKNLIPYPYSNQTITQNGGTLTAGSDGGVTGSGTPTDTVALVIGETIPITSKDIVTISQSGTFTNMRVQFLIYENSTYLFSYELSDGKSDSYVLDCSNFPTVTNMRIQVKQSNNDVEMSGTIYPQVEKGSTATSYSLYKEEGTLVTVTTCGKNLLDVPSDFSVTGYTDKIPLFLKKGDIITISCSRVTKGGENDPRLILFDNAYNPIVNHSITTSTVTVKLKTDINFCRIWSNGYDNTASTGVTSSMSNLMLEYGYKNTTYEEHIKISKETAIGEEIVCKQLNDTTNIFVNKIGVSLSSRFVLYNEELFHDKLTAIIGKFANRPTDITDYDRLYIATDKEDTTRSTILPAGKSGATASNWIYI